MMSCSCWHDTLFVTCIGCVFQYLQVRKWPTRVYLCVSWNFYRTFSESPVIWIHEHMKRRSISKWPRAHTMIWVELVEREHLFQNTCPGVKQVSHKKMKAVLSSRGQKQNPEVLKLVAQSCILVLDITSDHISIYQYFCIFLILYHHVLWFHNSFGHACLNFALVCPFFGGFLISQSSIGLVSSLEAGIHHDPIGYVPRKAAHPFTKKTCSWLQMISVAGCSLFENQGRCRCRETFLVAHGRLCRNSYLLCV